MSSSAKSCWCYAIVLISSYLSTKPYQGLWFNRTHLRLFQNMSVKTYTDFFLSFGGYTVKISYLKDKMRYGMRVHILLNNLASLGMYCKYYQKQPPRGVLKKNCSENMQQIYRKTPIPKCDFNKFAKELYWNRTLAWVFSCRFAAYFQNTFSRNTSGWMLLYYFWHIRLKCYKNSKNLSLDIWV